MPQILLFPVLCFIFCTHLILSSPYRVLFSKYLENVLLSFQFYYRMLQFLNNWLDVIALSGITQKWWKLSLLQLHVFKFIQIAFLTLIQLSTVILPNHNLLNRLFGMLKHRNPLYIWGMLLFSQASALFNLGLRIPSHYSYPDSLQC